MDNQKYEDSRVSIKEYFETKLAGVELATRISRETIDHRLAQMNEFRESLKDQASRLATRDELNLIVNSLTSEINSLREFRVAVESKASQWSVIFVGALGIVGLVVGIIGLFIN